LRSIVEKAVNFTRSNSSIFGRGTLPDRDRYGMNHPRQIDTRLMLGHVRFAPIPDSCSAANSVLFDHLVGAAE
jgi:hypothetical protein